MKLGNLPYQLERTVVIQARPETVFGFFTDSARWARWWGAGSTIDARPGGAMRIQHPGGVETTGEVVEVDAPRRIVFTYGFPSGKPIPHGSSLVTIELAGEGGATRLRLRHELPDEAVRDEHIQGWRFQLSLFSNTVANEVFAGAEASADRWFAAWAIVDAGEREREFAAIAAPGVRFADRYSALEGVAEIAAHAGAAQRFLPGIALRRKGGVRHCQGTALADWVAVDPSGKELMAGTNVFVFEAGGKLSSVTGLQ